MQEVSALGKAAAAKQQSHIQCESAVADLHERLKQSQQLMDAVPAQMEALQSRWNTYRTN